MSSLLEEAALTDEAQIVWLEDPENLDYVRQALDKLPRKGGKPRYARDGRMVGYSVLNDSAKPNPDSGLYERRVFFLLPHDRDASPEGAYAHFSPGEAVDPSTVAPGKVGQKTDRSQGRAPSATAASA
ncbi:DUF6009 family protein [Streptomyces sp. NPDC088354]|uniref:DUF6009 family protein n=1 Tax=Streptomyces sp. NPDC088354 TaxID=3365856 RepID=UPI00381ACF03